MQSEIMTIRVESDLKLMLMRASEQSFIPSSQIIRLAVADFLSRADDVELREYGEFKKVQIYADMAREQTKMVLRQATHACNTDRLIKKLRRQNIEKSQLYRVYTALEKEAKVLNTLSEVRIITKKHKRGVKVCKMKKQSKK